MLTPQSLQATVVGKTGSGGTSTGFKSKFKTNAVTTLTVKFNAPAAKGPVLKTAFTITVTVTAPDNEGVGFGVINSCVYVTGANNNGTPTQLQGSKDPIKCDDPSRTSALSAVTGAGGVATLTALVTKSGGLVLTGFAKVIDRSGTGVGKTKTNIAPQ